MVYEFMTALLSRLYTKKN